MSNVSCSKTMEIGVCGLVWSMRCICDAISGIRGTSKDGDDDDSGSWSLFIPLNGCALNERYSFTLKFLQGLWLYRNGYSGSFTNSFVDLSTIVDVARVAFNLVVLTGSVCERRTKKCKKTNENGGFSSYVTFACGVDNKTSGNGTISKLNGRKMEN